MNTRTYDISDFTKIRAGGAVKVEVIRATAFKVSVVADDFEYIRVDKLGDTLVLGRKGIDWFLPFHGQPEFRVEMPVLYELKMSGATEGRATGFKSDRQMVVDISGASHFDFNDITADSLNVHVSGASHLKGYAQSGKKAEINITGASHIELRGAAIEMDLEVNGASHANLSGFQVQNARVRLSGASHSTVNINGKLDTHVNGASNLSWLGTAVMGEMDISGASSIQRR